MTRNTHTGASGAREGTRARGGVERDGEDRRTGRRRSLAQHGVGGHDGVVAQVVVVRLVLLVVLRHESLDALQFAVQLIQSLPTVDVAWVALQTPVLLHKLVFDFLQQGANT